MIHDNEAGVWLHRGVYIRSVYQRIGFRGPNGVANYARTRETFQRTKDGIMFVSRNHHMVTSPKSAFDYSIYSASGVCTKAQMVSSRDVKELSQQLADVVNDFVSLASAAVTRTSRACPDLTCI